jgi:hypothetical protein
MTPLRRALPLGCLVALVVVACVPRSGPTQPSTFDMGGIYTEAALTLQAYTQQAPTVAAPTSTASPTPYASPTLIPPAPTLTVSAATRCYAGPGTNYGLVITIQPKVAATVLAQATADKYWLIAVPGYANLECWLSGQDATVTGSTSSLPLPDLPAPSIYTLSEPRNLRFVCRIGSEVSVTLRWTNTEANQTGVRIYRNNRVIATLRGFQTSYGQSFVYHGNRRGLTYGVQAYNDVGVSSIVTITLDRCQ